MNRGDRTAIATPRTVRIAALLALGVTSLLSPVAARAAVLITVEKISGRIPDLDGFLPGRPRASRSP